MKLKGFLTSSIDIFPTSLVAVGIKQPNNLILDGVNLLPFLKGEKIGDPHERLFWRKLDKSAARIGDYKTISLDGYLCAYPQTLDAKQRAGL